MKRKLTLRNRFILTSYASIVVSVILISIVSYWLLSSNAKKFTIQSNREIVSQKRENLNMRMDSLEVTIRDIIYGTELQRILREYNGNPAIELARVRTSINRVITGATHTLTLLDNIAVFSNDGKMIGSMFEFNANKNLEEYDWHSEAAGSTGGTLWMNNHIAGTYNNYGAHLVMPGVKKIRSVWNMDSVAIGEELGYIYLALNLDNMINYPQSDYDSHGRKMLVVNGEAVIIGGSETDSLGQHFDMELLNAENNNSYIKYLGSTYLLTYELVNPDLGWYVICLTDRREILSNAYMAIGICLMVSLVLLVVFWLLSKKNAESLSRPIERLVHGFEMVEKGEFDIPEQEATNIEEMDNLFVRFRVMAARLDTLIKEVYEARIKEQKLIVDARQAEMQALQMQINPHFLYNTLDSINWMALMQGNKEVSKMTIALGHLFRNNMNTTGIYNRVREELENIKLYMYLEQVRFEGKLTYEVQAEEEIMDVVILKHLLQPLVENSIKYGLEPYDIIGKIEIQIWKGMWKDQDSLIIRVSDNGKGIKKEKLDSILLEWENRETMQDVPRKQSGGVGLRNIMKRLYLCYGEQASFSIISGEDMGTETIIKFPLCKENE